MARLNWSKVSRRIAIADSMRLMRETAKFKKRMNKQLLIPKHLLLLADAAVTKSSRTKHYAAALSIRRQLIVLGAITKKQRAYLDFMAKELSPLLVVDSSACSHPARIPSGTADE